MSAIHIFCDESHTSPFKYRVQGGIWVEASRMREVRAAFRKFRIDYPNSGELKWSKVDRDVPRHAYFGLMDLFFTGPVSSYLTYKCLVVDSQDDPTNGGDKHQKDLGFYKAYWTLLCHRLEANRSYHVRLDERTSPRVSDPAGELRRLLNATGAKTGKNWDVLTCKGEKSKDEDLLQLADVLSGAIGWAWNDRLSKCKAKPILEDYIARHQMWSGLDCYTGRIAHKINIWKYTPKKR